ncbi:major facilitator superfamily domain-containing protein [Xylariaceae sp. FL0255]|nr:major facilitator superfamily domain-containing protein [Xylariaceae sp. FL0255]
MPLEKPPWAYTQPQSDSSPGDLHDVCLDDDVCDNRIPLPPGSRPKCLKNLLHECFFIALIAFAAATPIFLQRALLVVTASVAGSLAMSPAELAWSTASSGLTTGAFLLPFGYVADSCAIFPRKVLLLFSLTTFTLLIACTSLSTNGVVLDVLSGLTGIACAANIPTALGILSLVYPESSRRRNMVFSSFFMGTPTATIIGGLGSGALSLKLGWKAPFIGLAALYALVCGLTWWLVPNVPEPEVNFQKSDLDILTDPHAPQVIELGPISRLTALLQFDWVGMVLLVTGILLFTVSLTIGPEGPEPWKTPTVICLLTFGVLSLGCFVLWQGVAKKPMIPSSVWKNWSVILVIICTLGASMAFYSQLFWVSMFLQQVEDLNALQVAVRLLPQALVGLLVSPLVGLFMHTIPGTYIMAFAASSLTLSNVLLTFLSQDNKYMFWIFPSLMLSTVGMDWIMNVGSLHILACLPPKDHSVGASLLQTTSRLSVPLGLAITTSIWSSFNGKADWAQPSIAYTHVFIATSAFSGLSLFTVPLIRIERQGYVRNKVSQLETKAPSNNKPRSFILGVPSMPFTDSEKSVLKEVVRQPSKRWSTTNSAPSLTGVRTSTLTSISSQSSHASRASHATEASITKTTTHRGHCSNEKVIWVVCEECGNSKRQRESSAHTVLGDPTRYFNELVPGVDPIAEHVEDKPHHPHQNPPHTQLQAARRNPPQLASPIHHNAAQRPPFAGRRRLPLVNRQIMTHQILTQGFQP